MAVKLVCENLWHGKRTLMALSAVWNAKAFPSFATFHLYSFCSYATTSNPYSPTLVTADAAGPWIHASHLVRKVKSKLLDLKDLTAPKSAPIEHSGFRFDLLSTRDRETPEVGIIEELGKSTSPTFS
ncbi:hypothetical protein Syun_014638 [Stephania yunnanensis]|uniref:Uncharacterized protein n=1 Tax=Stephania yunnanensis TaxID=152371 RepID=A0AAP0P8R0_9MAGN